MKYEKEWEQCWLAYRECEKNSIYLKTISLKGILKNSTIIKQAISEIYLASEIMFKNTPFLIKENGSIILHLDVKLKLNDGGFNIYATNKSCVIKSSNKRGLLYGTFHLLRLISLEKDLNGINITKNPSISIRMLNHWDNIDGTIERGYSGNSLFFDKNKILINDRIIDYARLISSIGINSVAINNVNVKGCAAFLIDPSYHKQLSKLTKILSKYGIKVYLSINFASPIIIGKLDSADPCSMKVISWWDKTFEILFKNVPNLGGILVKADSEGEPGPFSYNRTHVQGANMFAKILKKYDAIVIWRCFVYNSKQDWRDLSIDRAKSSYDTFISYDGKFSNNVILQVKYGPMDFQIREPISPLFGALKETNIILEMQLAQEYTGQQIDICYLMPMYKEILNFDTDGTKTNRTIEKIISGKLNKKFLGGVTAVSNTGDSKNWTSSDFAAANLYGYGMLSFDPTITIKEVLKEWINLTFGLNKNIENVITKILIHSRETYEKYTTPFGIGWMVTPSTHYGPNIDGYEYSKWGTYHRADHFAIGIDRTSKGTGFSKQYPLALSSLYDDKKSCPEELLLFFHRLKYDEKMKNGKTLIQNVYDMHFEGVEEVEEMLEEFMKLKNILSSDLFDRISEKLNKQLDNAREWRDQVNSYFYRKSSIPDEKGRRIF